MKEELQGKLLEILTAIQANTGKALDAGTKLAGQAGDFAMEQLPDIAQSYVAFARAWETLNALLWWGITLALVYAILVKAILNNKWMDGDMWPIERFLICLIGIPITIGTLVTALQYTRDALFVWFAPKVWLIQELAKLIGAMKG